MMTRRIASLVLAALLLAGCGSGSSNGTGPTPTAPSLGATEPPASNPTIYNTSGIGNKCTDHDLCHLHAAVMAYSNAYLTGKALTSYDLLSKRCRARMSLSYWTGLVTAATQAYGSPLKISTFKADIQGTLARVTYTYDVSAINQTAEPWTKEDGHWHEDDC